MRSGVEDLVQRLLEGTSDLQSEPLSTKDIVITVEPVDNLRSLVDGDAEDQWLPFKRPHWPIKY